MQRKTTFSVIALGLLCSATAMSTPIAFEYSAVQTDDHSKVATGIFTFEGDPVGITNDLDVSCGRAVCGQHVSNPLLSISMNVDGSSIPFGNLDSSNSHVFMLQFQPDKRLGGRHLAIGGCSPTASFSNSIGLNSIVVQVPNLCVSRPPARLRRGRT